MAACVHCGVDECEAMFHECLTLDFTNPDYGLVHHLTVGAYMLQHNAYTDEMTHVMADFVWRHLDQPPGAAEKLDIRVRTDGSRRVMRRGEAPPLRPAGGWSVTIADVDTGSATAYRESVRNWAASVARISSVAAQHRE